MNLGYERLDGFEVLLRRVLRGGVDSSRFCAASDTLNLPLGIAILH
jgi:hypothetical protein